MQGTSDLSIQREPCQRFHLVLQLFCSFLFPQNIHKEKLLLTFPLKIPMLPLFSKTSAPCVTLSQVLSILCCVYLGFCCCCCFVYFFSFQDFDSKTLQRKETRQDTSNASDQKASICIKIVLKSMII